MQLRAGQFLCAWVNAHVAENQPVMGLTMTETIKWRTDGVKVVRSEALRRVMLGPSGAGRATAFDFAGAGGRETWIGAVTLQPFAKTGAHHHGRHEVAVYVVKGHGQIRWGERLEFAAEVSPGDFAYFAPYVPHQELNVASETLDFVVVRSDNERIVVNLEIAPVEYPERVEN
jgi:uncharacterized RmlC-like cupin family protein